MTAAQITRIENIVEDMGQALEPAPLRDEIERTQAAYLRDNQGFEGDKIVPITQPESLEKPTRKERRIEKQRQEMQTWNQALLAVLQWLCLGESDFAAVGRRAVAALLHAQKICGNDPTQAALAKQFKVSGAAMSKMVNAQKPQTEAFFTAISDWNP